VDLLLDDGRRMPQLGIGVATLTGQQVRDAVGAALGAGCRSIDTAIVYDNEEAVRGALAASGVPREAVFLTGKLWNTDHEPSRARRALRASLDALAVEQLDLYLIHWPSPARGLYVDAWHALVEAREARLTRSIGVANFHEPHLERIIAATGVTPVVNQVELHPYYQQPHLREVNARLGIVTCAWSPLGQGAVLRDPVLLDIADKHECTAAQVVLAWHRALGVAAVFRSSRPDRVVENLRAADIELDHEDLARIAALDRGVLGRVGPDPDVMLA
jgi:2,5-diketo-D-gluconate reductase A